MLTTPLVSTASFSSSKVTLASDTWFLFHAAWVAAGTRPSSSSSRDSASRANADAQMPTRLASISCSNRGPKSTSGCCASIRAALAMASCLRAILAQKTQRWVRIVMLGLKASAEAMAGSACAFTSGLGCIACTSSAGHATGRVVPGGW
jgi:hypothetical protein